MWRMVMTKTEVDRIKILEKIATRELTQQQASEVLKISLRQMKRLCKKHKEFGDQGIIHASRGKASTRRMPSETILNVKALISQEMFKGFGPTLLKEILEEQHQLPVSRKWLRQLMITDGLWNPYKAKKTTVHPRRQRRSRRGELIQIDGSYEYWFEGRNVKCCLLVMIDDATSEILLLRFVRSETTNDYLPGSLDFC